MTETASPSDHPRRGHPEQGLAARTAGPSRRQAADALRPTGGATPPVRLMIGRDEALAVVGRFVAGIPAMGGALLVTGEPGIGKSLLLDTAARDAEAAGSTVLRVTGVQFEACVSYSGLNQLLIPLLPHLERLSLPHRDALRVATGFGSGPAPDLLLVSTAALSLVRRAAQESPIMVVADDLPWLDRATAMVLGFVARRLSGSGIGFLGAARSDSDGFFERTSLPEYVLKPLPEDACHEVLRATHPRLAPNVRRRIVEAARGNPLALVELPEALSQAQQRAEIDLPPVLPLNERLKALFARRVAELSPACRQALLLAALDGTGDLSVIEAAVGASGVDDLGAAERARVVTVNLATCRLAFSHPLLASAVVETATSGERQDAHLKLAEVLTASPERRAWHLAESTAAPDESVAKQLEVAAEHALARGDAAGAIATLCHAARLSPMPADKSRRLAEAAYVGADAGGALRNASTLLDGAREADSTPHRSLLAAAATALLLINSDSNVETAHGLLTDALEAHLASPEPKDRFALAEALHTLLLLCSYSGRAELWKPLIGAVDQLGADGCELLWLNSRIFGDPARSGGEAVEPLERALRAASEETDPARVIRLATASMFADRLDVIRDKSWRVVRQGRRGESPGRRHIAALMHLCTGDLLAGRWTEVDLLAEEGLTICNEQGYSFYTWYFRYQQAYVAALRGQTHTSRTLTEQIRRWAAPRGADGAATWATHVRALGALGSGDMEDAYHQSCLVSPPGELAPFMPVAMWSAIDLVESAMRTGRTEEARRHARAVRNSDMAAVSRRMRLNLSVIEALTDPDPEESNRHFEAALSAPQAHRWPFDAARAELLYGEFLRRARRINEARTHLSSALLTFQSLGAALWTERTATELRAAGQSSSRRPADPADALLTPQELEIATLAASGLTNKQIGQRLFLSHRTVSYHLYNIYPKLRITTRAALRDALAFMGRQHL